MENICSRTGSLMVCQKNVEKNEEEIRSWMNGGMKSTRGRETIKNLLPWSRAKFPLQHFLLQLTFCQETLNFDFFSAFLFDFFSREKAASVMEWELRSFHAEAFFSWKIISGPGGLFSFFVFFRLRLVQGEFRGNANALWELCFVFLWCLQGMLYE